MTTIDDRVDGRECLRRLLAEAETELMTTQHVYLKLPLPLYLEYVAHHTPNEPTPVPSLSRCSHCSHHSMSLGSDLKDTDSNPKDTESDDLDPIYSMYANNDPKSDPKTGAGDQKPHSSNKRPAPPVIRKKNSTSTDPRTLEVEDDCSSPYSQDTNSHKEDQEDESDWSSGFISEPELEPEAVVMQRKSSRDIPIDARKKIRRDAVPSKLLLPPKYWQRGISTRLKPPTTARSNKEMNDSMEVTGGFHRLTRPRSVKSGSENPYVVSSVVVDACYHRMIWSLNTNITSQKLLSARYLVQPRARFPLLSVPCRQDGRRTHGS